MRIFVTGVAGFLGSHLAERLLQLGHEVVGLDSMIGGNPANVPVGTDFHQGDCCDRDAVLQLIAGCDAVYHCAALAYEGLSVFSPHLVTRSIVDGSTSVFSAAIASRLKRIIFCSSMARYGSNRVPFRESDTPAPRDPYGIAKLAAEQLLANMCSVHSVDYVIAVPHNIIGPRQKYNDPYRNVASIMANLILQGRPPIIYGDGTQRRCFSFIQDCIDPLVLMLQAKNVSGEVINIGPDDEFISINQLFEIFQQITGYNGKPIYVSGRPQEVREANCACDKAKMLLGYQPKTDLATGLRSIVEHIRKRGPLEFDYHLPIEIDSHLVPETWRRKIF
jgi:UDP-glucose 4-epimerase